MASESPRNGLIDWRERGGDWDRNEDELKGEKDLGTTTTATLGLGLASGFISFLVTAVILHLTGRVEHKDPPNRLSLAQWAGWAGLLLVMAFVEEALFRWFLIGEGSHWVGFVPALLGSSVLLTLAHRPNGKLKYLTLMNLILVGVILGTVFWWWGIWVATAAHFGWNLAEWGIGYTVSGEKTRQVLRSPTIRVIRGEPFGPEAHWATTVVLFVVATILTRFHFR
jgi:hypothetical protein